MKFEQSSLVNGLELWRFGNWEKNRSVEGVRRGSSSSSIKIKIESDSQPFARYSQSGRFSTFKKKKKLGFWFRNVNVYLLLLNKPSKFKYYQHFTTDNENITIRIQIGTFFAKWAKHVDVGFTVILVWHIICRIEKHVEYYFFLHTYILTWFMSSNWL